jgi:CPA1 family monovalent cation:H+ antiporter
MSRVSNKVFPEKLKLQSRSIWDIIIFLLNGLIFILIGLQFPYIIKNIRSELILPYIGYGVIITILALLLRTARVFMQQVNLQRAFQKGKGRITENALLDFKNSLIISWSGMRGIVSLAIAIGLPLTLKDGSPFPERNAIIFISVVVVLVTLIGQGITLPWIVKAVKLTPEEKKKQHG